MAHGAWRMAHGAWRVAHGAWRVARGAWRMARGAWRVACGVNLPIFYALFLPHALCALRFALCALPYALCPMRPALCALPHAPGALLDQSFNEKFDQFIFLVGFYDFITAGFGPGRKIS